MNDVVDKEGFELALDLDPIGELVVAQRIGGKMLRQPVADGVDGVQEPGGQIAAAKVRL